VLIGSDIVKDLFPSGVDPLGKRITVAGLKLSDIEVSLKVRFGFSNLYRVCFMPITTAREYFLRPDMTFALTMYADEPC